LEPVYNRVWYLWYLWYLHFKCFGLTTF
jgi:hypothetical protein